MPCQVPRLVHEMTCVSMARRFLPCEETKMKRALLAVLVVAIPAAAQTTQKDVLLKHWKTSGEFTLAVASAMPADAYNFRPTPEEMSFGQLVAHIAMADRNACTQASGLTAPGLPPAIEAWAKDSAKVDVSKEIGR